MPVNLSIKNAPDELVERLRQRAKKNHRSLQGELMAIVEAAAPPEKRTLTIEELLQRNRSLGLSQRDEATQMIREDRDSR